MRSARQAGKWSSAQYSTSWLRTNTYTHTHTHAHAHPHAHTHTHSLSLSLAHTRTHIHPSHPALPLCVSQKQLSADGMCAMVCDK